MTTKSELLDKINEEFPQHWKVFCEVNELALWPPETIPKLRKLKFDEGPWEARTIHNADVELEFQNGTTLLLRATFDESEEDDDEDWQVEETADPKFQKLTQVYLDFFLEIITWDESEISLGEWNDLPD